MDKTVLTLFDIRTRIKKEIFMNGELKRCSFSGHRTVEEKHKKKLPELLLRAIEYAYSRGCRTFYAGGAIGFDTYAAREVLLFRIVHPDVRLVMLLPCKNQDLKWSAKQRDAYNYIIASADEVVYVSDDYSRDCMRKRNTELVRRSDILIAYLAHKNSGSSQTVSMAERAGIEVYNLYPALDRES